MHICNNVKECLRINHQRLPFSYKKFLGCFCNVMASFERLKPVALSAGAIEYVGCNTAEG